MINHQSILSAAVGGLIVLGTMLPLNSMAEDTPKGEKCYGVAKAGKNDCKTAASACAGSSKEDNDPSAFIYLPSGTCEKIAGGNLESRQ